MAEVLQRTGNLAGAAIQSLEKRLQKPAVLVDAYEPDWQKALRFGLKFCLAPIVAAGLVWWITSDHYRHEAQAAAQAQARTPEAIILRNMEAMRAQLTCSLSADQNVLTLRVIPSPDAGAWHLLGDGIIRLASPSATASAGTATSARHP